MRDDIHHSLACMCTHILEFKFLECRDACVHRHKYEYWVAMISRLLQNIGLFCRIQSLLQCSLAKETYNFKEPNTYVYIYIYIYIHINIYIFIYIYVYLYIYIY